MGNRTDGCDGLPALDGESAAYQSDVDSVDTRLLVSYSLYGLAALSLGYGIYSLATFESTPEPAVATFPVVGQDYVGAAFMTRF